MTYDMIFLSTKCHVLIPSSYLIECRCRCILQKKDDSENKLYHTRNFQSIILGCVRKQFVNKHDKVTEKKSRDILTYDMISFLM